MPLPAGSRFGRYVIEALLGKGGMGQVYRARDTLLRRQVALKILRAFTEAGERDGGRTAAKILREARVAAAFQHPNAVAIFDLGEHNGQHFLAMELVSGCSLRELVGRPDISMEQRVRWLADIARALDAAHRAGIVHLDIKPDNVMVNADGVVKVLDFGIARRFVLDRDVMSSISTVTGTAAEMRSAFVGTPRYMAPEQVRRTGLDGRTDQFSWGVVAYELLTGVTPWQQRDSLFDLLSAIVHEPARDLREVNPDVSEPVAAVVMRAMSKQPDERFPGMGELVTALEHACPLLPSLRPASMPVVVPTSEPPKISALAHSVQPGVMVKTDGPDITAKTVSYEENELGCHALSKPAGDPLPAKEQPADELRASVPEPFDRAEQRLGTDSLVTSQKTLSRRRRRLGRRWMLVVLLLGMVLGAAFGVGAWFVVRSGALPAASAPAPSTSAPVAPVPTTLLDLALPSGCNAEALAQFRAGIQAQHDGNWEQALARYEAAAGADSECAAAHLRLTMAAYPSYPTARTREIYQRAIELRVSLSERDRQLLDALDPLVRRDPSDAKAFTARMLALAERFPSDAEIACLSSENDMDFDARIARARAALALDAHYSDAWQELAGAYKHKHQLDEARAALDECLRLAPNSVDCIRERIDLDRRIGRCDEMVTHAQLWIARAPKSANGFLALASALAAQGAPVDTIEEAYRQRWARLTEPKRSQAQALDQALLDGLTGRFDRAVERARELNRHWGADPSYEPRVGPVLLLVNAALETNQIDEAAKLASDFLGRKDAWSKSLRAGNIAVKTFHIEPLLLDIQYRAGKLTEQSWRAARVAWVQSARSTGRLSEETLWALGTAMPVQNRAQAIEALRSMPESLKSSHAALQPQVLPATAFAGRALLLAGRIDEALPFLRRAVTHCDALQIPFEETQANLWLGQALEKKGDVSGACAAYQVVERRWGGAMPVSVTAATAKERRRTLKCAD